VEKEKKVGQGQPHEEDLSEGHSINGRLIETRLRWEGGREGVERANEGKRRRWGRELEAEREKTRRVERSKEAKGEKSDKKRANH